MKGEFRTEVSYPAEGKPSARLHFLRLDSGKQNIACTVLCTGPLIGGEDSRRHWRKFVYFLEQKIGLYVLRPELFFFRELQKNYLHIHSYIHKFTSLCYCKYQYINFSLTQMKVTAASETSEEQLSTCLRTTTSHMLVGGCVGKLHMFSIGLDESELSAPLFVRCSFGHPWCGGVGVAWLI